MSVEILDSSSFRLPVMEWSADGLYAAFECSHIGVSGTTPIFVKRIPVNRDDFPFKYEARMGIAIMGGVNDPDCYKKNPFDENWCDNFVKGVGYTLEVALRKLKESVQGISEGLWAF